jgi:AcrR family transcriptional regulator
MICQTSVDTRKEIKIKEEKNVANEDQILSKKQRKIKRTKKIILDAAELLFNESTYEDVRVDDIAEKSALSKATVYNYFHSKEGIYFGIGVRAFQMINDITGQLFESNASGIEILEQLIRATMKGRKDFPLYNEITNRFLYLDHNLTRKIADISRNRNKGLFKVNGEVISLTNLILADYLDQFRVFTQFWSHVIRRGVDDGTIVIDRAIEEITEFIFIAINGIVQLIGSNFLFHNEVVLTEAQAYELTVLVVKKFLGNPNQV